MITSIPDDNGRIIAYCEWRQVAQSGIDKYKGEYIWVNDIWVHPEYRKDGLFIELLDKVLCLAPDAKYGYFTRSKYNDRMSSLWKRERVEKMINRLEYA